MWSRITVRRAADGREAHVSQPITRRSVLAGTAAVTAAVGVVATPVPLAYGAAAEPLPLRAEHRRLIRLANVRNGKLLDSPGSFVQGTAPDQLAARAGTTSDNQSPDTGRASQDRQLVGL
jgi:hypothetical protein